MSAKLATKNTGNLQTFPVSAGLLEPRHVQAIDPSSPWPIYLWFLEHVTRDEQRGDDFVGIVLHGGSISVRQIAEKLGIKERACRRNLARLVKAGYVLQKQTGTGTCIYAITKSKRWAWKRQRPSDRAQSSKTPESQASLSFPTHDHSDDSPHQKVVSGSGEPPHQKVVSGSASPHHFLARPDQKVVSAERGTRARSQVTKTLTHAGTASDVEEWVYKIAAEHPKLSYLKDTPLPNIYETLIVDAIVRHGGECVLTGTRTMRIAVSRWAPEDRNFIPGPEKFFRESQYLKPASEWERSCKKQNHGYVPLGDDYEPASVGIKRELERRRQERAQLQ